MSPSSRRAWVEIGLFALHILPPGVALLTEGVGRNRPKVAELYSLAGCPPRRGCG